MFSDDREVGQVDRSCGLSKMKLIQKQDGLKRSR